MSAPGRPKREGCLMSALPTAARIALHHVAGPLEELSGHFCEQATPVDLRRLGRCNVVEFKNDRPLVRQREIPVLNLHQRKDSSAHDRPGTAPDCA